MPSLTRLLLLFVVATATTSLSPATKEYEIETNREESKVRQKRGIFFKNGIFGLMGRLIFEQWNDTKNTYNDLSNIFNSQFADESPRQKQVEKPSDPNSTTTETPKITRSELNRILQRNLRGLVRLFNIELQDALQNSQITYREVREELAGRPRRKMKQSSTTKPNQL